MKIFLTLAMFLAAAGPALAQLNPNGNGSPSNMSSPNHLQPKASAPDLAPPALPGASAEQLDTGPNLQKPITGDPTAALFAAINSADYNAAQDAVSRGADIGAQNSLGETPLDLSIALNHNNITFMLLSARNESAENGTLPPSVPMVLAKPRHLHATRVKLLTTTQAKPAIPFNDPGTPNLNAGFLGFAAK